MIVLVITVNLISSTVNIQNQPIIKSQNLNDVNCSENQIIYAEIINNEMTYSCRDDNFKQVAVGLGCYLGLIFCLFVGWLIYWFRPQSLPETPETPQPMQQQNQNNGNMV
ncbi:Hypothetical_protein [Hexamita inflata]|uniref:Hypothetical_protein n=1 Tax=Hexamita inflata TaxID=28002 RepID=A0ABP1HYY9_9EUKA